MCIYKFICELCCKVIEKDKKTQKQTETMYGLWKNKLKYATPYIWDW